MPRVRSRSGYSWSGFSWSNLLSASVIVFFCATVSVTRCQQAEHFRNVTETLENLLKGYDIRLRPSFGGE
ncbi:hypothetical protein BsWGS_27242 [Bradybaena similaris]